MNSSQITKIAFIGFGEVGQRFAKDFREQPAISMTAFDVLFLATELRETAQARAANLGVAPMQSAEEACESADIIISAVTADQTEIVAQQATAFLKPGQIFFDVNSASPETKRRAARVVNETGADYIEAAAMAPVRTPGIAVPILAGGPRSADVAERLNAMGMCITSVAQDYGRASAIKLCRSIMIKGIETLMVDCSKAVTHFGVAREVYASLGQTFPSIDWATLADAMTERVATHGVRRAAEMREAADMLREAGFNEALASAVAEAQARGAKGRNIAGA